MYKNRLTIEEKKSSFEITENIKFKKIGTDPDSAEFQITYPSPNIHHPNIHHAVAQITLVFNVEDKVVSKFKNVQTTVVSCFRI